MCTKCSVPINAEVVEDCCFLSELRTNYTGYLTESFNFFGRRTALRQVVTFVATVQDVAEAILYAQILVDLVFRSDVDVELRLFLIVLVIALTV